MVNDQPPKKVQFSTWYKVAPITGLLFILYLARPSSYVFPFGYEVHNDTADWHRSFFGIADWLLCGSILCGLITKKIRPPEIAYWYCLCFLVLVFLSILPIITDDYSASFNLIQHAVRLTFLFLFGAGLVRVCGIQGASQLLYAGYCILAISALVVLAMILPALHRIFASAMTVASFAQISAIVALFAIHLKHFKMAAWAMVFLVLTFSLSSALAFSICLLAFPANSVDSRISVQTATRSRLYVFLGLLTFIVVSVIIDAYSDRGFNTRIDHALTLHGRVEIWQYGIELIRDHESGWFGVGFGRAPSFLRFRDFSLPGEPALYYSNFHSIILESLISMGIFAAPIFMLFIAFFFRAYKHRHYLEASVISFFMMTQSVDFTLYRPKEETIFAFVLGVLLAHSKKDLLHGAGIIKTMNGPESLLANNMA